MTRTAANLLLLLDLLLWSRLLLYRLNRLRRRFHHRRRLWATVEALRRLLVLRLGQTVLLVVLVLVWILLLLLLLLGVSPRGSTPVDGRRTPVTPSHDDDRGVEPPRDTS